MASPGKHWCGRRGWDLPPPPLNQGIERRTFRQVKEWTEKFRNSLQAHQNSLLDKLYPQHSPEGESVVLEGNLDIERNPFLLDRPIPSVSNASPYIFNEQNRETVNLDQQFHSLLGQCRILLLNQSNNNKVDDITDDKKSNGKSIVRSSSGTVIYTNVPQDDDQQIKSNKRNSLKRSTSLQDLQKLYSKQADYERHQEDLKLRLLQLEFLVKKFQMQNDLLSIDRCEDLEIENPEIRYENKILQTDLETNDNTNISKNKLTVQSSTETNFENESIINFTEDDSVSWDDQTDSAIICSGKEQARKRQVSVKRPYRRQIFLRLDSDDDELTIELEEEVDQENSDDRLTLKTKRDEQIELIRQKLATLFTETSSGLNSSIISDTSDTFRGQNSCVLTASTDSRYDKNENKNTPRDDHSINTSTECLALDDDEQYEEDPWIFYDDDDGFYLDHLYEEQDMYDLENDDPPVINFDHELGNGE